MNEPQPLADLPLLPRDESGPVFAEPWQAQAFAVVVGLMEAGKISAREWADRLGAVLEEAEARGEYDTGRRYYDHWLTALEQLVVEKQLTDREELAHEGEAIRAHDHHRREAQLGSRTRSG
ncbi:MAG TPA: nitrile hydratase accessory protein [Gammaproteobacteria bacterium]|nr:nitrile hydratase accessory protein [Gammaproteobacteria bacterium]